MAGKERGPEGRATMILLNRGGRGVERPLDGLRKGAGREPEYRDRTGRSNTAEGERVRRREAVDGEAFREW